MYNTIDYEIYEVNHKQGNNINGENTTKQLQDSRNVK